MYASEVFRQVCFRHQLDPGASRSACGLGWLSYVAGDLRYPSPLSGTVATLALAQAPPQGASCFLYRGLAELDSVLSCIPAIVSPGLGHSQISGLHFESVQVAQRCTVGMVSPQGTTLPSPETGWAETWTPAKTLSGPRNESGICVTFGGGEVINKCDSKCLREEASRRETEWGTGCVSWLVTRDQDHSRQVRGISDGYLAQPRHSPLIRRKWGATSTLEHSGGGSRKELTDRSLGEEEPSQGQAGGHG